MPLAKQQAPDDLAEAPEAGDDHRAAVLLDRVVGALVAPRGPPRQRACRARSRSSGVSAIDSATASVSRPAHSAEQDAGHARDAEHDERELAALREQRREQPALPRRHAHRARDQPQR